MTVDTSQHLCYNKCVEYLITRTERRCIVIFNNITKENQSQEIQHKIAQKMRYKAHLSKYIKVVYEKAYENCYDETTAKNRIENYKNCGTTLVIDAEGRITGANFCKQRLCPVCNYRKSLTTWHKINEIVEYINSDNWLLLTVTVKNCTAENLVKTINQIMQGIKHLTNHRKWRDNFDGYFRSLEITYNANENTYHPHVHMLIIAKKGYFKEKYITFEEIRKMWEVSCGLTYRCNVDIRKIKDVGKGIAEVAKYAVKMSSVLETDISSNRIKAAKTIFNAVYKRRLTATGGIITKTAKALKINLESDEETYIPEGTPYIWNGNKYIIAPR